MKSIKRKRKLDDPLLELAWQAYIVLIAVPFEFRPKQFNYDKLLAELRNELGRCSNRDVEIIQTEAERIAAL